MNLADFKSQNTAYKDIPDEELAKALHSKFYSNIPFDEFAGKVGLNTEKLSAAEKIGGAARSLYGGLTFGFADEAEAGIGAAYDKLVHGEDFGKRYGDRVGQIRKEQDTFRNEMPKTAIGSELAGGLMTGVAGGAKLLASKPIQWLPKITRLPAVGSVFGGTAGAGASENMEDLPVDVLRGAVTGAFISTAIPAVGWGLGKIARPVLDKMTGPATVANRKIVESMERDSLSANDVAANLRAMGGSATIADAAGENTLGLARASAAFPGKAKDVAAKVLDERQYSQSGRILDAFQNVFGKARFHEYLDELDTAQRTNAKPLYDSAYSRKIPLDDKLRDFLSRPTVENAVNRAYRIAADNGDRIPKDILGPRQKVVPTKVLDYVKRGLDDVIESSMDDFGRVRGAEGYSATKLKSQLLKMLDDVNPDYAAARKAYAGPEALKQATRKGSALFKEDADDMAREFSKMTASEQDSFRVGAMQALKNKILSSSDTADTYKRVFNTPIMREKLKTIFPDDKSFGEFQKFMKNEAKFFKTRSTVLGGSPTARIEAEKLDALADPNVLVSLAQGRPISAMFGALRNASSSSRRMPEKVSNELASILFTKDPVQNQRIIQNILVPAIKRKQMHGDLRRGGLIALSGETAGLLGRGSFRDRIPSIARILACNRCGQRNIR